MQYLVDTSIWIEYFEGSEIGRQFHELNNSTNKFFSTDSILAETKEWCLKRGYKWSKHHNIIKNNSKILESEISDWLAAVEIKLKLRKSKPNFGIVDALILQKQNEKIFLTKDKHFKGLPNVKILE